MKTNMKKTLMIFTIVLTTMLTTKAQETVTGRVVDFNGNSLPGVSVTLKGTEKGTITNLEGNYTLGGLKKGDIIIFSFIGMLSEEITFTDQTKIDVTLIEDITNLNEVVVIGYGSIKKRDLTGSVASVGNEDIVSIGTTSPMAALQGQVAGVNINANTGLVGSSYSIDIRGVNSLAETDPLYVVDGVTTDNINFLNPHDIERIDILKDASSTAIYGSRGTNGVVIVTTKSGKTMQGKTIFNYSGSVGLRTVSNMPDFISAEDGIEYIMNRGITKLLYAGEEVTAPDDLFGFPSSGDAHDYWLDVIENKRYEGNDWLDLMLKPSLQTNHFISGSGGTEKISYMIGAGYQRDNGNIDGQYYEKYNFKGNIDAKISDLWSIGSNINLAYSDKELLCMTLTRQLFRMPNWALPYDEDGEIIQQPMTGISGNVNPLLIQKYNQYNTANYYLISNFYLSFSPVDWITIKSVFSPNIKFQRVGQYLDKEMTKSISYARNTQTQNFSYIWDNQINMTKQIDNHNFDFTFIYSMQLDKQEYLYGYGYNLPFTSLWYNVGSGTTLDVQSSYEKSTLMSYTSRLNYSLSDKYLFTASARWDGSSKLSEENRWAFFPSAAVAWRISEESFMDNSSSISNLKLRLSFGYTGNNSIDAYTTSTIVDEQTYYDWDGSTVNGFKSSSLANKDLTWERTREWDLGLDFGLFKNRISGEVNLYDKLSLNLLMERKLAVPSGYETMLDNVGSVSNKGVELQLRTININRGDFSWETSFTFSKNKNEIVELYGKKEDDVANRWFIGEPVEVVYAMVFDGIYQRDELDEDELQTLEGTAKVKDLNGDDKIDTDNDMMVLGSPLPKWIGSFSTKFTYKNWDLSATLYTKQGVFTYSPFHCEFTDFNSKQILDVPYYMRENDYTEAHYSNEYPQPYQQGIYWGEDAEDYGYPGFNKDASLVRLQNIALGYDLGSTLERFGISKARLYLNVLNPYVWTKYDGFDPEWADAEMSTVESNSTSFTTYQFGINLTF